MAKSTFTKEDKEREVPDRKWPKEKVLAFLVGVRKMPEDKALSYLRGWLKVADGRSM